MIGCQGSLCGAETDGDGTWEENTAGGWMNMRVSTVG